MHEIRLDRETASGWFEVIQEAPFRLVKVSEERARALLTDLAAPLRRCYVSDDFVLRRTSESDFDAETVIRNKLPDPGSTMSGEFGEILVYIYQAATCDSVSSLGVKKWQWKIDRNKPVQYSDVVHFVLDTWPATSDKDMVMCSEVKTKATTGTFDPINKAIEDSNKDKTSRLGKTLLWFKERVVCGDLKNVSIAQIDRFLDDAVAHPAPIKDFRAVAVICESLEKQSLLSAPKAATADCTVIVISIPALKDIYEAVYVSAINTKPSETEK